LCERKQFFVEGSGVECFPRPGTKSVWAPPPSQCMGSIDAKSELGAKGRRKLIWLWRHRIDARSLQPWKSLTIV